MAVFRTSSDLVEGPDEIESGVDVGEVVGEVVEVWKRVAFRNSDAVEGTIVPTRSPIS